MAALPLKAVSGDPFPLNTVGGGWGLGGNPYSGSVVLPFKALKGYLLYPQKGVHHYAFPRETLLWNIEKLAE